MMKWEPISTISPKKKKKKTRMKALDFNLNARNEMEWNSETKFK